MPRARIAAVGIATAWVLTLAGCGDHGNDRIQAADGLTLDDNSGSIVVTTTTVAGLEAGPTSAATPGSLHPVGEAVATASGNTVTLHAVNVGTDGAYAVDVETCANAGRARVQPSLFVLQVGDGTTVPPASDGRQPALAVQDLAPGTCGRGWVTFRLPAGQAAVALEFHGSSVIFWSLT